MPRHALLSSLPDDGAGRSFVDLSAAERHGVTGLATAPRTLRILAENLLRQALHDRRSGDRIEAALAHVALVLADASTRGPAAESGRSLTDGSPPARPVESDFAPARVLLQDHSGIPVLAEMAMLRSLVAARGADPQAVNPVLRVDLVVDHSIEAYLARRPDALAANAEREYALNAERYRFLRWAQRAFANLRVVPPGHGIVHQIHLEHLADVVTVEPGGLLRPDTVIGTDSHTPMVNSLGVLGWGVGGIEATLALLGDPLPLVCPEVVGVRLLGEPLPGVLATDVALAMTEFLRARDVTGAFVEFFGEGLPTLSVPDRATVANMAPEYGSTVAFFPPDDRTLDFLRLTGRSPAHVELVGRYARQQRLFWSPAEDVALRFSRAYEFDLSAVEVSVAGPRRPQDRLALGSVPASVRETVSLAPSVRHGDGGPPDGGIAIAAITSCTNTANPTAMVTAGLLAHRAVALGLRVPDWVKTSLAPGSRTVTAYLDAAGLLPSLAALGFHVVGYGCTTCIGNSGNLLPPAARAVAEGRRLIAVLSGNRNFEGRIHPGIAGAYLMSPPLVVAYALAGAGLTDLSREPVGVDTTKRPVFLRDLWPTPDEVAEVLASIGADLFRREEGALLGGDREWSALSAPAGALYDWPGDSTYLRPSPLVAEQEPAPLDDIHAARILAFAPDTTTTDHISPAGPIPVGSSAGAYLAEHGVPATELNSYGCRRGNHEVLVRGTFANPRFRNRLTPSHPGAWTRLPDGSVATMLEAAEVYAATGTPLLILAGRDYGMGSSRDWAAKGPRLLGVRAVLATSFERIHRSNLVGVGIVPLQFPPGVDADSLGLSGREHFFVDGLRTLVPRGRVRVRAVGDGEGSPLEWPMIARVDSEHELVYLRHGGFLATMAWRLSTAQVPPDGDQAR